MKKMLVFILLLLHSDKPLFCQGFNKRSAKSVYAMYGRHFSTKYHNTSGPGNIVGRRFPFSLEAGVNVDYYLNKNLFFRIGIASHLHFISEITYGISGPYPPLFSEGYLNNNKYGRGIDYIELGSLMLI